MLIGLFSPSGGGKSYSALRLCAGMERVTKKPTFAIDSEASRLLHYADFFKFQHVPFAAPFGSLDYLEAIDYCVKGGAGQIIVDSVSHYWEGEGGVLDSHEAELTRIAGSDFQKRERCKMLAWVKPKADSRKLINFILQTNCNFVFCFRAKEKMKIVRGKEPEALGFQPIAGDEFIYEMTMNLFLPPHGEGVPSLNPNEIGEKLMVKIPRQFSSLLNGERKIDEDLGEKLARWAAGDPEDDGRAVLLAKITAYLTTRHPGKTEVDKQAKLATLIDLGLPASWREVSNLSIEALEAAVGKMTEGV